MRKIIYVKAGKLFCLSEGEYSDFGYVGHFLALEDITDELFARVKKNCKDRIAGERKPFYLRNGKPVDLTNLFAVESSMRDLFVPELIRTGAVVDVDLEVIHIGDGSRLEI
jgi:hypothetical protein